MNTIQQTTQQIPEAVRTILTIGGTVLALLLCFTGFRMVKKWISVIGFIFGAVMGYRIAREAELGKDYWFLPLLIGIIAGLALGALGYRLFKMGLFVFCGAVAAGAVSVHILPTLLEGSTRTAGQYVQVILQAAVFILAGILAVKFSRAAIILVSAIGGARIVSANLAQLMPKYFPDKTRQLYVFAGLALIGILFQFLTTKKE